jgi:hypothetical protein
VRGYVSRRPACALKDNTASAHGGGGVGLYCRLLAAGCIIKAGSLNMRLAGKGGGGAARGAKRLGVGPDGAAKSSGTC